MKKIVSSSSINIETLNFDIEIILDVYPYGDLIAASEYKGYMFPDGELPPAGDDVEWSEQITADYNDFLETLEDLLTDYYGFHVYYHNLSKDHSKYLGMLAKDDKGKLILNFNFTFRVSNHDPHRSKESQYNKKKAKQELAKITKGKRLKPTNLCVIVNKEEFDSYDEAIAHIDRKVEYKLKFMRK